MKRNWLTYTLALALAGGTLVLSRRVLQQRRTRIAAIGFDNSSKQSASRIVPPVCPHSR
jgi:hypothetical protein